MQGARSLSVLKYLGLEPDIPTAEVTRRPSTRQSENSSQRRALERPSLPNLIAPNRSIKRSSSTVLDVPRYSESFEPVSPSRRAFMTRWAQKISPTRAFE